MIKAQIQSAIHQFQSWFFQAKTTNPDDLLNQPPEEIIAEFAQKIDQLPQPLKYRTTVQETLSLAIENWQQNPKAANSLVILGSPVEAIAQIIQESLTVDFLPEIEVINPFTEWQRSTDPSALQTVISNALSCKLESQSVDSELSERQTLIVIPSLTQCFLRCIQGWEGIEFLQNTVIQNKSQFWLIGCNDWAWKFLNQICQISSYLEQVQPLTKLEGDEIQKWLAPITAELKPQEEQEEIDLSDWKSLASIANGISSVSANLWLQSLRIRAADVPDSEVKQDLKNRDVALEVAVNLRQTKPILPSIPDLTAFDRYLLHSLLLHGQMTRPHLALSLGESEQIVRSHIQMLERAGVIVQQQEELSLNPVYYPTLKTELSNNNFLIGDK
ncbi:winged helix-turn-helix domain-containing protein [Anabaena cylindrica UHCC 0172]|uniref:winged helix-turn-helix domain-containing protein n=1 Tax=Anabaena cylindrica TaxID=1165 RepID=UPI002B21A826|nr:winged helix-turn-helix domain-containing protein [Anabaena cylindrica]MEA5550433.1 winged helix-turn-helix domain-containing protein [Anabaena cylindrica UHCC 0172]